MTIEERIVYLENAIAKLENLHIEDILKQLRCELESIKSEKSNKNRKILKAIDDCLLELRSDLWPHYSLDEFINVSGKVFSVISHYSRDYGYSNANIILGEFLSSVVRLKLVPYSMISDYYDNVLLSYRLVIIDRKVRRYAVEFMRARLEEMKHYYEQ